MTQPFPPLPVPSHVARVAVIGCIDDRLVEHDAQRVIAAGRGFLIRLAGGGIAVLTKRDQDTAIGQFTDSYGITPYDLIIVRLHLECGKCLLQAKDPDFSYELDPGSVVSLYEHGDRAAARLQRALSHSHGVHVPAVVEVVRIAGSTQQPVGVVEPRPEMAA